MKTIFTLISPMIVFCISCGGTGTAKKVDPKELYGKTIGNNHKNSFFNIEINVPSGWKMNSKRKIATTFGSNMIDAEWFEDGDTTMPNITFVVESRKVNPFDREASEIKELNETYEGLLYLYDKNEAIMDPLEKIRIADKTFIHSRITLLDQTDTSFMDEYVCKENGYFISILYGYESSKFQPIIAESLKSIKRLK